MAKKKTPKKTATKKNPAKNKNTGISSTALAKKLGVSDRRIRDGVRDGLLSESVTITKHGKQNRYKFNEELALKEWADNIDPAKQRDPEKAAETRSMNGPGGSNYQKAKGIKEYYAAKLAELDYQQKAGKLVSADRVKAESFKIGRRVRDSLLGVPERIAAEIAVMDDPRQISIYVKEQLALALKDLGDLNDIASGS